MTTNTEFSDASTRVLGRYEVDGRERQLVAVSVPDEATLRILDVLVQPLPDDGDVDPRQLEESVSTLSEAEAIAADYIRLAERLGWTPMPDVWW